ncbi:MAG: TIGR03545 family protein [Elusimicrobiota bacterium]|nr:TIGR03545 family protein [Elusimicrobiota bacterium]
MKYIRWKALIPLLIFSLLLTIFFLFFLDTFLKKSIISAGESIFGAKVEISYLNIKLKHSSIEIKGLQIADKSDPWKNLFEIDRIKFDFRFIPILSKKFIIEDMTVEGIKWSTKRDTYGGLPPRKLKRLEKKRQKEDRDSFTTKLMLTIKQKAEQEIKELPIVQNIKSYEEQLRKINIEKLLSEFELESKKTIIQMQQSYTEKYQSYIDKIQKLDIDQQVSTAKELLDELSSVKIEKYDDIKTIQTKVAIINEKKKSIEETLDSINRLKSDFDKDFVELKDINSKINSALDSDYKNILSKLQLPEFKKENISKTLFGQMWIDRVNTAINYIHLARKYFQMRKEKDKKTIRPRMRGVDVVFHKKEVLPNLWIKKIFVSGTTGGKGKDNEEALLLSGLVTGITSDQLVTGEPTIVKLSGKKLQQNYVLEAIFDRTKEVPVDTIKINVENLVTKNLILSNNEWIPKIDRCNMSVNSTFALIGEELDCNMIIWFNNINFAKLDQTDTSDELKKLLYEIFSSMEKLYINAKLYGRKDSLSFEINSNIDDLVINKMKTIFGRTLQEYKERIKSELEKNIMEHREKFFKEYTQKKDEFLGIYNEKKNTLEQVKAEIEQKVKQVNLEINRVTDTLKKKAEEEIKKRLFR